MSLRNLTLIQKVIVTGLGIGFIGLCVLFAYAVIVVANEPLERGTPTPALVFPPLETPTLTLADIPTEFATLPPTFELPTPTEFIPTPQPTYNDASPPSGKIAFACYIQQIDQICLLNADGSGRKQLTSLSATAFYPSVSPDGQTIFFSSRDSGNFEIYSIDINGNNLKKLTNGIGSLYAPEMSPNGEWVIFTNGNSGLWLMRPDGRNPRVLTTRNDIDPTWSPDGSMIAFASSRSGARQLFIMNADGTDVQQVTDLNNMGGRNTWSPDGSQLAFYRGPRGDRNIYIINIDGTGLVRLTNGGDNLAPSWSPDGEWITFTSYRDGNNELYIMRPDGTDVRRLTNSPISDWQPRWGP